MGTNEINLTVSEYHISFFQLGSTRPDRLDLPAFQHQPGFESLFNEIVVKSFFVFYNAHVYTIMITNKNVPCVVRGQATILAVGSADADIGFRSSKQVMQFTGMGTVFRVR